MSDKLSEKIDPLVFAERRRSLAGKLGIEAFSRLVDVLAENAGSVLISMQFDKEGRQSVVTGSVRGELQLICQSCLHAMSWSADFDFKLGIVTTAQEVERLGDEYEPLLIEEGLISPAAMIEDEILLRLPDYPKHQYNCVDSRYNADRTVTSAYEKADNPFSILAKLKKTGD